MKETCPLCGRRARRFCPARNAPICPQCCGRGRRRTIDCPDECPHFVAGVRQALRRLAQVSGDPRTEIDWADVLHNLRLAAVRVRDSRLRDAADAELAQAFANVADTLRTRSHGLVYDYRSPDPRVQLFADEVAAIAGLHERGERGFRKVGPVDLAVLLRYVAAQCRAPAGAIACIDLFSQSVSRRFAGGEG